MSTEPRPPLQRLYAADLWRDVVTAAIRSGEYPSDAMKWADQVVEEAISRNLVVPPDAKAWK